MSNASVRIGEIFEFCGFPEPLPDEISAWNALDLGATATGEIRIGLFNYDMTCVAGFCAAIGNNDGDNNYRSGIDGYCNLLSVRQLDGQAFGGYWKIDIAVYEDYCAGFRNNEPGNRNGNIAICNYHDDGDTYVKSWSIHGFH